MEGLADGAGVLHQVEDQDRRGGQSQDKGEGAGDNAQGLLDHVPGSGPDDAAGAGQGVLSLVAQVGGHQVGVVGDPPLYGSAGIVEKGGEFLDKPLALLNGGRDNGDNQTS